jgi:hypothetical protein
MRLSCLYKKKKKGSEDGIHYHPVLRIRNHGAIKLFHHMMHGAAFN